MAANNVLGIIFSNAYDEVLPELTALRTMGSVPFAGRYRLIDFPLSNMVNAGITKVGVITKSNYRSLMDHIGTGKSWDLSRKREGMTLLPPFNTPESGMFRGKLDALYGSIDYISRSDKEFVLLTDCNTVCSIDYEDMLAEHIASNADITVAYAKGIPPKIKNATEFTINSQGRVIGDALIDCYSSSVNYSLKTMLIRRTLLERFLHEAKSSGKEDFEAILPQNIDLLNVHAYEHKGFVRVLESLRSYYETSLELLKIENRNALFTPDRPVFTKVRDQIPAMYGIGSSVKNSLIADGCHIDGTVENSILFRGVTVAKGAVIKNSIVMQDTYVGEGSSLESVIADKAVVVKSGRTLCGAASFPVYIGKGIVI